MSAGDLISELRAFEGGPSDPRVAALCAWRSAVVRGLPRLEERSAAVDAFGCEPCTHPEWSSLAGQATATATLPGLAECATGRWFGGQSRRTGAARCPELPSA